MDATEFKDAEPWLTAEEAAGYLQIEVSTVKKWVKLRQIPHGRAGSLPRFRRSELDRWMKEKAEKVPA